MVKRILTSAPTLMSALVIFGVSFLLLACSSQEPAVETDGSPPMTQESKVVEGWKIEKYGNENQGIISVVMHSIQIVCDYRLDSDPKADMNIEFPRPVTFTLIEDAELGYIHEINSKTSVNGNEVPTEWTGWLTYKERIGIKHDDAVLLVQTIIGADAESFRIELPDDPDLSQELPVSGLKGALAESGTTCFK